MKRALALALALAACALPAAAGEKGRSFVLLHGEHLDGDVWAPLRGALERKGHAVRALTLPGRGGEGDADLGDMAAFACAETPTGSTVVAHGRSGAVANAMLGVCPERVARIVYVAAVVPLPGESAAFVLEARDAEAAAAVVETGPRVAVPRDERAFFVRSAPDAEAGAALPKLHAEPVAPATETLAFDRARFEALPKAYVRTRNDGWLSAATQAKFVERTAFDAVYDLDSGHLPMWTRAQELAFVLTDPDEAG